MCGIRPVFYFVGLPKVVGATEKQIMVVKIESSSSGEIYEILLENKNGLVKVDCSCPAGQMEVLCKHRIALLNGDISVLLNESDANAVTDFLNEIEDKIANLFAELNETTKEIERLNGVKKVQKRIISRKLSHGF